MRKRIARHLMRDATQLTTAQRMTHTYVLGQPGTGKSRALEAWAMQDILAGQGVAVLDPHGDLFDDLLARLAAHPSLWERVVVIDPGDSDWVVSIDPLRAMHTQSRQRLALFVTDIIVKIWRIDSSHAPRMVWLLANSFLALAELDLTLLDLPRFLLDRPFREALLPRVSREEVLTYFHLEYPQNEAGVRQWATPVLNKLGGLLFDPDTRAMLAGYNTLDFRQIIDHKKILLVNLSKGLLGEGASALLGAFIVALLQKAALSRADTRWRQPYYLYLDEFQNYTTGNIRDILAESRKYALSLTLAHQYLEQLPSDVRAAVLNTAGTLVCFRVAYRDAARLAQEIFSASQVQDETRLGQRWLGGLPLLSLRTWQQPLSRDRLVSQLTSLPQRQFWSRQRAARRPLRQRTLEMPDVRLTRERRSAIASLREGSGWRYATPRWEVEHILANRRTWRVARGSDKGSSEMDAAAVPLWGM